MKLHFVLVMILFQEKLTVLQFLGAAGVVAGAIMAVYAKNKGEIPETKPADSSW